METAGSTLHAVCETQDFWDGEMDVFEIGDETEVLLLKLDGNFYAYQAVCPHQNIPLVEGKLDQGVLTCRAHLWQFAADTGLGINPSNCKLARFPVRVDGNTVHIGDRPMEE